MSALAKRVGSVRMLDVERARDLLRDCRDVDTILAIRDSAKLAVEYRRLTEAGREAINEAQEVVLRAQRKFGEFLLEHGRKGRPKKDSQNEKVSPGDLGIEHNESARCQKLAAIPDEVFERHLLSVQARGEKLTTAGTIAATSHADDYDSDEWYTPADRVTPVRLVLGEIDLDPASNNHAQLTVQALRFYTKGDDGLVQPWVGRTFLNPPYKQPLIGLFIQRFIDQFEVGNVPSGIVLVNNATDTTWCQGLLRRFPACFTDGRIPFEQTDGAKVGTRQGQIFFYAGPDVDRFTDVFDGHVGTVMQRRRAA